MKNSGCGNSPPPEGWRKFREFLTGWFNDPVLLQTTKFLTHKKYEVKSFENRRTQKFKDLRFL